MSFHLINSDGRIYSQGANLPVKFVNLQKMGAGGDSSSSGTHLDAGNNQRTPIDLKLTHQIR